MVCQQVPERVWQRVRWGAAHRTVQEERFQIEPLEKRDAEVGGKVRELCGVHVGVGGQYAHVIAWNMQASSMYDYSDNNNNNYNNQYT